MPYQTCGGGGTPGLCGCTPVSCAQNQCGMISDGCGKMIDCGNPCSSPQTCGGGGTPGLCGCTKKTCADQGAECDSVSDGCGGTIVCGNCNPPQTCGGGGKPLKCGCTPNTCTGLGLECGTVPDDGCGQPLTCPTCLLPKTCGGDGRPHICGCLTALAPNPASTTPITVTVSAAGLIILKPAHAAAQTFTLDDAATVQQLLLTGSYAAGEGGNTVTLSVSTDGGTKPGTELWHEDFVLNKTRFAEGDNAAPVASTFTVSKPFALEKGVSYWFGVATTASAASLGGLGSDAQNRGDAIKSGSLFTSTGGNWMANRKADLDLTINPCR